MQCGLPSPSTGTLSLKEYMKLLNLVEIFSQYQGMNLSLNKDAIFDELKTDLASIRIRLK